jgi:hypothetical protein
MIGELVKNVEDRSPFIHLGIFSNRIIRVTGCSGFRRAWQYS